MNAMEIPICKARTSSVKLSVLGALSSEIQLTDYLLDHCSGPHQTLLIRDLTFSCGDADTVPEEMVKKYYSSAHALAPIQLLFRRRW